jgi:nucleotide-binding universal stress UspA family protein
MLSIKKILLPVDFPNASLGVVHQAATLARHFQSEIVMLHVVTAQSHTAQSRTLGVPEDTHELAGRDMLAEMLRDARENQDLSLGQELEGLAIKRILLKGEPARAIVQAAQVEKADLVMMPSHGQTFNQFLLGSVTAKVLHGSECPVWTSARMEGSEGPPTPNDPQFMFGGVAMRDQQLTPTNEPELKQQPAQGFAIHNVLCAVDLGPRSEDAVSWAAQMAAEFGARLTLAHVTASVERWGPGGIYVDQKWKAALVGDASQRIANLQQEMGIKADVFIGSGDVPKVLNQAVKQTKADLLVTACYPYGGNLRIHGYAIITAVPIPVLSV